MNIGTRTLTGAEAIVKKSSKEPPRTLMGSLQKHPRFEETNSTRGPRTPYQEEVQPPAPPTLQAPEIPRISLHPRAFPPNPSVTATALREHERLSSLPKLFHEHAWLRL